MTPAVISSCGAVGLWVLLAALIGFLRPHHRLAAFWIVVVLGVPVLGWLTLNWGPSVGVGAFALGLALLLRRPSRPRTIPETLQVVAPPSEQGRP